MKLDKATLLSKRKNIFSENGEDGIFEYLFEIFNIKSGTFCEFGAWDGIYGSNTYNLLKNHNFSGVMIEADKNKYKLLENLISQHQNLEIINSYVDFEGRNKLDNILSKTKLPFDFDLLSIDIDGYDYYVWKSLINYKPKFVIIEINSNVKPGDYSIYSKESNTPTGFSAVCELGIKKGYFPIFHSGNVIFADINLLTKFDFKLNLDINQLYCDPKIFWY